MEIYIPTLGRPHQETLFNIPPNIRKSITLVLAPGVHRTIDAALAWGIKYVQCPHMGIGKTRQWILDRSPNKVLMLDDDLVFATRRDDEPTKFVESKAEDITRLFTDIEHYLDRFAHVGVSTREGGNRDTGITAVNTRLLRILAYRADVLRTHDVRFDRVELMEDFDVTLQLLERGYPNLKVNWIVHNQRSSNAPGGCSTYRTIEKQGEAAHRLAALHPDFVSVVTKQTKTAWNGKERQDVIVQWKRAFDSSGKVAVLDTDEKFGFGEEKFG